MKMIFGGIYRRKKGTFSFLNKQRYDYYIPVAYREKEDAPIQYKMTDTYMVPNPYLGDNATIEKRLWFLEQANCGETSGKIFWGHGEYFYQNIVVLSSDELDEDEWELVADLHEYSIISDEDAKDYSEKDLLKYVPLWNEDSYRWHSYGVGKIYLRKGAKKDGLKRYYHSLEQHSLTMNPLWDLDCLEKDCKDILKNMELPRGGKAEIKITLKKVRKYRKLAKEYKNFCDELAHPKHLKCTKGMARR